MHHPIEDTSLVVTNVLYQKAQTSLLRDERGESVTLLEITDSETGQKGHLYHEIAGYKRDIEEENFWTDTPALFANNHPEAYVITDLSGCGPEGTPTERTPEIDRIIRACKHRLEYCEGGPNADGADDDKEWGLYVVS